MALNSLVFKLLTVWIIILAIFLFKTSSQETYYEEVSNNGDSTHILGFDEISSLVQGIQSISAPGAFDIKMLGIQEYPPSYIDVESDADASAPGAARAANHSLSATCSNQYCDMLVTILSCKSFGIHLKKICAGYLAGAITGCPAYPAADEIYNAPYFCAIQIGDFLTKIGVKNKLAKLKDGKVDAAVIDRTLVHEVIENKGGQDDSFHHLSKLDIHNDPRVRAKTIGDHIDHLKTSNLQLLSPLGASPIGGNFSINGTVIKEFLLGNFTENCRRRCFQRYIEQGNYLFTGSCRTEVLNPNNLNNYKFLKLVSVHQEFRNQICVENPTPEPGIPGNCYDSITTLASKVPGGGGNPTASSIFNLKCQYNISTYPNSLIQLAIGLGLTKVGCCVGNQIALINQNPLTTAPTIFPPCLLRYIHVNNPTINPANLCYKGANGNMSVFHFTLNVSVETGLLPVNVYDMTSILTYGGIIIGVLSAFDQNKPALPPYTLNKAVPLQSEIINYVYYKKSLLTGKLDQLTPINGETDTSDYLNADYVTLNTLLVFEGLTQESEVDAIKSYISSPFFSTFMEIGFAQVYMGKYKVTADVQSFPLSTSYYADAITPTVSSGFSIRSGIMISALAISIVTLTFSLV